MGAVCDKPGHDRGSSEVKTGRGAGGTTKGGHELVGEELAKDDAEELLEVPRSVAIMTSSEEEAAIARGNFVIAKFPSELTVLFVGDSFSDMQEGFYYPLLPATPVLFSDDCVITLDAGDGDAFGVRLPSPQPAIRELLVGRCDLRVHKANNADKVAGGMVSGGKAVAGGLEKVVEGISKGIHKTGDATRSKMKKGDEVKIGDGTKMGVAALKGTSHGTVKIAGKVVDGLMTTALELGKKAAGPGDPNAKESDAAKIGKAGALAGLQVFDTLIKAGDRIRSETMDETAACVGHKYGEDAGKVTRDGMGIAEDIINLKDMVGKQAVAKMAAKASLYTAAGMLQGGPSSGSLKK